MLDKALSVARAQMLGIEKHGLQTVAREAHEADERFRINREHPQLELIRPQRLAHERQEELHVILAEERVRRPHGAKPELHERAHVIGTCFTNREHGTKCAGPAAPRQFALTPSHCRRHGAIAVRSGSSRVRAERPYHLGNTDWPDDGAVYIVHTTNGRRRPENTL